MSAKQTLRSTLAAGKIHRVIEDLLACTAADPDLHQQAVALSARYSLYARAKNTGQLAPQQADLESNQIIGAALHLIEQLPDGTRLRKKISWEKVALWLGIFAAVAGVTGYTMKDFFKKPEPPALVQPAAQPADTLLQQTTHGPNSPNVKTESGDVNIQYGDDSDWEKAAQKPKSQPDTTRKR